MSAELETNASSAPFWLNPGLSEYINSENPGFKASFKVIPEDFLVTELKSGGDPVVLDNYEAPEERKCDLLILAAGKRKLKQNFLAPPSADEISPLRELISSDKYDMLEEMADSYKLSLKPEPSQQIDLGAIEDKQRRSQLHGAVKLTFPALLTETKKNEQGQACVRAHHDPKYVKLLEVLTKEEVEQLLVFVSLRSSHDLVLAYRPREDRTKIHNLLNILFGKVLNTKYVEEEVADLQDREEGGAAEPKRPRLEKEDILSSKGHIKVTKQRGSVLEGRSTPEKARPPDFYTRFVMKKRLVETNHALQLICDAVRCSLWDIKTQGIKDKSAISVQEASIKNVRPSKLLSSRPHLLKFGIDVGNCTYASSHVQKGGHFGNHFSITLKDLVSPSGAELEAVIEGALNSVRENGFVNYFGMQRMGGANLMAPQAGLAMLNGDLKEAVRIIFAGTTRISQEAKDLIDAGLFRKAMELLPRDAVLQRLILKSLIRYKGDDDYVYQKALQSIPHDSCLFYMQSFCSLLWNHAASYRIREYGMKLVEGDLVVKGASARWWDTSDGATVNRSWVHPVTAEDVKQQTYGLQHVVLPILGNSMMLPKNRVGDKLAELMAVAGITMASFRKNKVKIPVSGSYRSLLTYPRNLSWSFIKSPLLHPPFPIQSTPAAVSITRDIRGSTKPCGTDEETPSNGMCGETPSGHVETPDTHVSASNTQIEGITSTSASASTAMMAGKGSELRALKTGSVCSQDRPSLSLKFELGRNSFATMLIREVMKHNV